MIRLYFYSLIVRKKALSSTTLERLATTLQVTPQQQDDDLAAFFSMSPGVLNLIEDVLSEEQIETGRDYIIIDAAAASILSPIEAVLLPPDSWLEIYCDELGVGARLKTQEEYV